MRWLIGLVTLLIASSSSSAPIAQPSNPASKVTIRVYRRGIIATFQAGKSAGEAAVLEDHVGNFSTSGCSSNAPLGRTWFRNDEERKQVHDKCISDSEVNSDEVYTKAAVDEMFSDTQKEISTLKENVKILADANDVLAKRIYELESANVSHRTTSGK